MRYLSVCSGIEAASVAWHPLGWTPHAFAEIEAFPSAVLAHHFPHVPNLGDMTNFKEWPDAALDVLVGGTPCQSFSVAGLRAGLADPRGNLALTYLAIADRYRPRWLLWENVPGVLSSNGGRDFGAFLGGLGQLGYGFAYRVLDAQHIRIDGFGRAVPQRRRRVFVVGYLGDWRCAAAVLFDAASLYGDSAPRREPGKGAAPTLAARTRGGGGLGTDFDCDGGLVASSLMAKDGRGVHSDMMNFVAHSLRAEGFDASEDGTGRGTPLVPVAPFAIQERAVSENPAAGPQGKGYQEGIAYTLEARERTQAVAFAQNSRDEVRLFGDDGQTVGVLAAEPGMKQTCYVATEAVAFQSSETGVRLSETHATLDANNGSRRMNGIIQNWAVRRLTPTECERLQGFPDGWTAIPYRGKPAADGPRYKALGNSMACNAMRWIGYRMGRVERLTAKTEAA